jgi:predicted alpha/beta superfamily hydrolase
MKSISVLAGLLLATLVCCAQTAPQHTVTGDVEIVPFTSKTFNNTRNLRILLPPGYHDMTNRHRKYPVMYMQDGQNLYDNATTAFGHEWQVDETMQRLWSEHKVEPMLIVGIDNAGEKRGEEYLPYPDNNSPQVTHPRAADYGTFLIDEVMPYIAKHYRVKPGPENTGIGGSSYGGLVSLYTVMKHPGIFGHVLLESMPLHIQDEQLIRDAQTCKQWPQKIFLGIGTNETPSKEGSDLHVSSTRRLADVLHSQGLGDNRVKLVVTDGAEHNEQAWSARFPGAMEFLWSR